MKSFILKQNKSKEIENILKTKDIHIFKNDLDSQEKIPRILW